MIQVAEANEGELLSQENKSIPEAENAKNCPEINVTEHKGTGLDEENSEKEGEGKNENEEEKDALAENEKQKRALEEKQKSQQACPWLVAKYHPDYELLKRSQGACTCCSSAKHRNDGGKNGESGFSKDGQRICTADSRDLVERPETADEAISCVNKLSELELNRLCQLLPQSPEAMLVQGAKYLEADEIKRLLKDCLRWTKPTKEEIKRECRKMNIQEQKEIVVSMGYQFDKKDVSLALSKLNQKDQYYAVEKSEVVRIPVKSIIRAGKSLETRSLAEIIDNFSFEGVLYWVEITSEYKKNEVRRALGVKCTCSKDGQGDRGQNVNRTQRENTTQEIMRSTKCQCLCKNPNETFDLITMTEGSRKLCLCNPNVASRVSEESVDKSQVTPSSISDEGLSENQYVSMSDHNFKSTPNSDSKTSCWSTIEAETDRLARTKGMSPCEKGKDEDAESKSKRKEDCGRICWCNRKETSTGSKLDQNGSKSDDNGSCGRNCIRTVSTTPPGLCRCARKNKNSENRVELSRFSICKSKTNENGKGGRYYWEGRQQWRRPICICKFENAMTFRDQDVDQRSGGRPPICRFNPNTERNRSYRREQERLFFQGPQTQFRPRTQYSSVSRKSERCNVCEKKVRICRKKTNKKGRKNFHDDGLEESDHVIICASEAEKKSDSTTDSDKGYLNESAASHVKEQRTKIRYREYPKNC